MSGRNPIIEELTPLCVSIAPVGSRVTCSPPPTDTDADYLVLLSHGIADVFFQYIDNQGFVIGGSVIPDEANIVPVDDRFFSYLRGDINLIVTLSESFHRRFLTATYVSKRLNLMMKNDRIALFQAVLYGNQWKPTPDPEFDEPILAEYAP